MNQFSRNVALWLVLGLMFLLLFNLFNKQQVKEPEVVFSDFMTAVDKSDVAEVTIQGHNLRGKYHNGERFKTYAPDDPDLVKTLRDKGVKITAKPEDGDPWYVVLFVQWFPMLLLIGVWIFFMRQMQVGGGKAMSFGKSRAKLLSENTTKVTFNDVSGIDEAKEELEEIIAFLKDPKKFTKLGGRIPKGVLLVGSPGTGKTLLARASSVFPVPGEPTSRTPLGMRPPSLVNFFGSFRKAMISSSSSFASSMPETSLKVTFCVFSLRSFARLLPKDIAFPPPTCIWRMKKIHTPISSSMGNHCTNRTMYHGSPSSGLAAIFTPFSRSTLTRSGSSGAKVLKRSPL